MSKKQCKATTKSGQRCKKEALESGYCIIHDPNMLAKRKKKKKQREKIQSEKRKTIERLLSTITKACESTGWYWRIDSQDQTDFLSATIYVSKTVSINTITALISIVILSDNAVEYSIEKTSFYNYGISALSTAIYNYLKRAGWIKKGEKKESKEEPLDLLLKVFKRFHVSGVQLSKRHDSRNTLLIQDEYDVQDYIHAILKILFDDIRPEEYSPSYAGSSSKIDFLLKDEKTLVEVKFATSKLRDNKIGEQLIVDIERYKNHPDCETVTCFVYDPNFNIKNPYGLEKDLSGKKDKLNVKVFVYPK